MPWHATKKAYTRRADVARVDFPSPGCLSCGMHLFLRQIISKSLEARARNYIEFLIFRNCDFLIMTLLNAFGLLWLGRVFPFGSDFLLFLVVSRDACLLILQQAKRRSANSVQRIL